MAAAVRLTAGLLTLATVLWAAILTYVARTGMVRQDLDPEAARLYFGLGRLACVGPPLAWLSSFVAPYLGLGVLVGLFVFALLPLEAHPREVRPAQSGGPG